MKRFLTALEYVAGSFAVAAALIVLYVAITMFAVAGGINPN